MSSIKVTPALTRFAAPVRHNIARSLRVPVMAATLMLGSTLLNKAQAQEQKRDTFTPSVTLKDTNRSVPKNDTVFVDTTATVNDTIYTDSTNAEAQPEINNLSLNTSGTAAEELYLKVLANISSGGETPYSAIYLALLQQQNDNTSSVDIGDQIDDIIECMKVYAKDHQAEIEEQMNKNGSITEFRYGPDNSKTGTLIQTMDITGINQKDDANQVLLSDSTSNTTANPNDFIGNVAYRVKAVTEKAEVDANIHAGSDNVDIQMASMYKTQTDNGGNLSLSLNGRETIEGSQTNLSAGASLDYCKNDFSSGLYYYYNRENDESGISDKYSNLEGYLKYKQNIKFVGGLQDLDVAKYYYTKLKLLGSKNLTDYNLKLSGTLSAEAGRIEVNMPEFGHMYLTNADISALGGIYFKTDDITASLNGRASYNCKIDSDGDNDQNLGLSILGAFNSGKISVSAMFSMFKEIYSTPGDVDAIISSGSNLNLATSVGFEIKDLFKGISPQFSYTSTSIGDQVQHFFNVTLKTSLEALKKTQQ